MEPAHVLDFCEKQRLEGQGQKRRQFREMMHEELDEFLDELMVVFEEERRPSLSELSDLLTRTRQGFLGSCL